MTPPKNVKTFNLPQIKTTSTTSETTQKTQSEKAAEAMIAYFDGLLNTPKKAINELKTEGSAMYNAFIAYKDGDFNKCKQILKEEFDRAIMPLKNLYNVIKNKFK